MKPKRQPEPGSIDGESHEVKTSGQVGLYAVVAAEQALAGHDQLQGLRLLTRGPITAVVGKPETATQRAAMRHDRIVGRALSACASVVPFRLGVVLRSQDELLRVLDANQQVLTQYLARFHGQVEVALKAKLPSLFAGNLSQVPFSLEKLHSLAPDSRARQESVQRTVTGQMFDGCYLIARQDIDAFWQAVEQIRQTFPNLPLLGSGPWAPYSFCDFTLCPAQDDGEHRLPRRAAS
ncbi:GvpL/GvpF family gas vesicle protein [Hyalangium versicolor]|uniref:GvpL/GvpF family gas vesicle protein n=1 Tax=Hyalangium versicolor TaxID=2861190 RepID=UPI001CCA1F92|nr:GvpL/GvpF family gas vesicle protein [Hyalangium versicolor]